jgi:hypothetical protein
MSYYEKYLLYKKKYINLKSQRGGSAAAVDPELIDPLMKNPSLVKLMVEDRKHQMKELEQRVTMANMFINQDPTVYKKNSETINTNMKALKQEIHDLQQEINGLEKLIIQLEQDRYKF